MESPFKLGMKHELRLKTGPEHSARKFYADLPDAFATPFLVGLMEGVSADLMAKYLQPGEQSVGIGISLKHTAPTPLGMEVRVVTELVEVDGKKLSFKLEAFDEKEKIGEAQHERFIINAEKFSKKLASKAGG
ncbi:MAG: thioesterase family protein [Desulfobacca sp.]|uniref:thioesterase family protein n=1 Tax=Desulfobacca sp. TaxID=2067990 RepID=UPI00404A48C7